MRGAKNKPTDGDGLSWPHLEPLLDAADALKRPTRGRAADSKQDTAAARGRRSKDAQKQRKKSFHLQSVTAWWVPCQGRIPLRGQWGGLRSFLSRRRPRWGPPFLSGRAIHPSFTGLAPQYLHLMPTSRRRGTPVASMAWQASPTAASRSIPYPATRAPQPVRSQILASSSYMLGMAPTDRLRCT